MIWGVTGTREGATPYQVASVGWLFSRYGITGLHDGDCIGADKQVYHLARAFGISVDLHPPVNDKYRAFCGMSGGQYISDDLFWPEKGYHERDKDIVNESEALVACPRGVVEEWRSGTWLTIRYARKVQRPIAIVWPKGRVSYENWTELRSIKDAKTASQY